MNIITLNFALNKLCSFEPLRLLFFRSSKTTGAFHRGSPWFAVRNVFDPAHPGTRVYGRGDAYLRWEDQDDEVDENMPVPEPKMPKKGIRYYDISWLTWSKLYNTRLWPYLFVYCLNCVRCLDVLISQYFIWSSLTIDKVFLGVSWPLGLESQCSSHKKM